MIKTTEKYWDCECKHLFIHPKKQKECKRCGVRQEDQPDSRVDEVKKFNKRGVEE